MKLSRSVRGAKRRVRCRLERMVRERSVVYYEAHLLEPRFALQPTELQITACLPMEAMAACILQFWKD